ncbi:ankyrin-3-like [Haliotis rufescens]|uniref:ankyrin-3-like n=1 Tax=Haliotis rufescens TaxID=6454 RepID=UPI00201F7CC7|nr:ankyrin-3-like [Haliotis rufescens]XP_048255052.1 ankyrin-3-like [Haliotis rufescens]
MNSAEAAITFLLNAQSGDMEGVCRYLDAGGDPNFTAPPRNMTALLMAVKEGHTEIVKELLKRGADINCRSQRGVSCVHTVAMVGDEKMLDLLLEYGLKIDSVMSMLHMKYTPLYLAAQQNHHKVIEKLLLHGADPLWEMEVPIDDASPCLAQCRMKASDVAMVLGNAEALSVFILWCHRLGPFTHDKVDRLPNHTPSTAATLRCSIMDKLENLATMAQKKEMDSFTELPDLPLKDFIKAAEAGKTDRMTSFSSCQDVNATTPGGLSALHMACLRGNMNSVNFLLTHGARVNLKTEAGFTPLYFAAQEGYDDIVKLLLKAGADPCLSVKCGMTPLGIALSMEHSIVVATILSLCPAAPPLASIDSDYLDAKPDEMLLRAAYSGDLDQVKMCIDELGFDPNKVTSIQGAKAIHLVCMRGHTAILNELLSRNASIHYKSKRGIDPVHCAARHGHVDILGILLNHGAYVNNQTEDGMTPLYIACLENQAAFIETLLLHGADPDIAAKGDFICADVAVQERCVAALNTLLMWCNRLGPFTPSAQKMNYVEESAEKVQSKILTAIGEVSLSQQIEEFDSIRRLSSDGNRLVLEEARKGNTDFLHTQLLQLNTAIPAARQLTPLHCASFGGHTDTVHFLVHAGVDVDKQTKAGFSALYLAGQQGHLDVVEMLLNAGADPTLHSQLGLTPLGISMYTKQHNVMVAILSNTPGTQPISIKGTFFQKRERVKREKRTVCVIT